jgi:hypothetical protein
MAAVAAVTKQGVNASISKRAAIGRPFHFAHPISQIVSLRITA